tara:strand:+ start:181 stop:1383 length:1203 start_codon:yes stop_codon:yes gene_type:complete
MKFLKNIDYKNSSCNIYVKVLLNYLLAFAPLVYLLMFKEPLKNEFYFEVFWYEKVLHLLIWVVLSLVSFYNFYKILYNISKNYKVVLKSILLNAVFWGAVVISLNVASDYNLGTVVFAISVLSLIVYIVLIVKFRYILIGSLIAATGIALFFTVLWVGIFTGALKANYNDNCTYKNILDFQYTDKFMLKEKREFVYLVMNLKSYSFKVYNALVYKEKECNIKYGYSVKLKDNHLFKGVGGDNTQMVNILTEYSIEERKRYSNEELEYYKDLTSQLNNMGNILEDLISTNFYKVKTPENCIKNNIFKVDDYEDPKRKSKDCTTWLAEHYTFYYVLLAYIDRIESAFGYKHITQEYRVERLRLAQELLNRVFYKDSPLMRNTIINNKVQELNKYLLEITETQ